MKKKKEQEYEERSNTQLKIAIYARTFGRKQNGIKEKKKKLGKRKKERRKRIEAEEEDEEGTKISNIQLKIAKYARNFRRKKRGIKQKKE